MTGSSSTASGMGPVARVRDFYDRYHGADGLFFIKRVNHPLGSVIGLLLLNTRATPNMVSVAGFFVHVLAALVLFLGPAPLSIPLGIAVLVLWQLAFSLDCADGQLARARRQTSPFGAWLDQVIDVATHTLVYSSLSLYVVRALGLDPVAAAAFTAFVFSLHLLQLFSSWQRAVVLGSQPAVHGSPPLWLTLLLRGQHLLDYGAFLFLAGLLLLWPAALLVFLVISSVIHGLGAAGQLALNWLRYLSDSRAKPAAATGQGTQSREEHA